MTDLEKLFEEALQYVDNNEDKEQLELVRTNPKVIELPEVLTIEMEEEEEINEDNLYALIQEMTIPQKIKLAMFGNKAARQILIKDTNKQVPIFVLKNPRIGDGEITDISKNTNFEDRIYREITKNSNWMKSYNVKFNIVSNPKVSIDVSMKWLKYIKDKDLGKLAKSKNIPNVISTQARKLVEKRGK